MMVHKKTSRKAVARTSKRTVRKKKSLANANKSELIQPDCLSAKDRYPHAFIHPFATVEGLVDLGKDCSIWGGAVLRGDMQHIKIGCAVNIQDNCTLHTDSSRPISVGDYSLVGHNAIIHGCTIGKACLIGIGCIILDEAMIGDGAMITAGCLIRGAMRIPPRAMVVQKNGILKIYENKAKPQMVVSGCLEYIELARRHRKNQWGPFNKEEVTEFNKQANQIISDLQL